MMPHNGELHPILARLHELGKSQRGLAFLWGVDPSRITRLFKHQRSFTLSAERFAALAEYAEMPIADVVKHCASVPDLSPPVTPRDDEPSHVESTLVAALAIIDALQGIAVFLRSCLEAERARVRAAERTPPPVHRKNAAT